MDLQAPSAEHEDGGLALLDDHRPVDTLPGCQPCAIVDRHRQAAVLEINLALRLGIARLARQADANLASRVTAVCRGPPADHLDIHVVEAHAIQRFVSGIEARAQLACVAYESRVGTKPYRDFGLLAEIAHVRGKVVDDAVFLQPRFEQCPSAVRHHVIDQPADQVPVDGIDTA
jgi:hypothetical protein